MQQAHCKHVAPLPPCFPNVNAPLTPPTPPPTHPLQNIYVPPQVFVQFAITLLGG